MANQYLLAIDQGTTGTTAVVLDVCDPRNTTLIGHGTVDFPQHYPQLGWVEHDLEQIWGTVRSSILKAIDSARAHSHSGAFQPKDIVAIGITNQRETLCTFERKSGRPITRAIVWQCKRSADICRRLKKDGAEQLVRAKTGLVLDPYFSGTKMTWLLENNPEVAAKVRSGQAVWGTIDSYLLNRLTGGEVFATEASNASRTLIYNIASGAFDPELAEIFKVPSLSCLPEVKDSAGLFGKTKGLDFLPDGIPIAGILGDQQAALAGQTCFKVGEAKCTYGTGAFLLMNTGHQFLKSQAGLISTVAWSLNGRLTYAFEGAAFIAGAAIQFLRDQMGMLPDAASSERMAQTSRGAPDIYFVPALAGLGVPYWDPEAKGAILGLTRGASQGDLVRATLEGIAFQVNDLIKAMSKDVPSEIVSLRVDGGAAANNLLMQIQADLSGLNVDRPYNLETTATGAALFAGLGVGIFSGIEELMNVRKSERTFVPTRGDEASTLRGKQLKGWDRAVRATQVFAGTVV